jgi:DNA-binding NarL/FixJ family response regulator
MWLQFARWIDANRSYSACKECGRWFEVSTDDGKVRKTREFCSDRCKSKHYRRRQADALRLKSEGKSVAAIAKQLETPVKTIKTWTDKRKG